MVQWIHCHLTARGLQVCMFSLGSLASSHSPKTYMWGQLGTLNFLLVWMGVSVCLSFHVALWWTGHLSRVSRCLHPMTTGIDSSTHTPVTLSAGGRGYRRWMDGLLLILLLLTLSLIYVIKTEAQQLSLCSSVKIRSLLEKDIITGMCGQKRRGQISYITEVNGPTLVLRVTTESHQKPVGSANRLSALAFQCVSVNCQGRYVPWSTLPFNFPLAADVALRQQLHMWVPSLNLVVDVAAVPTYLLQTLCCVPNKLDQTLTCHSLSQS